MEIINYDTNISGPAIPHNVAFQATGLDATVTWDLHGDYIASMYIVEILTGSGAVKSVCHLNAYENSAFSCSTTLLAGVHYDTVAVTLSVSSTCSFIPEGKYGILQISYTTGQCPFPAIKYTVPLFQNEE